MSIVVCRRRPCISMPSEPESMCLDRLAAEPYQSARSPLVNKLFYRLGPFPAAAACLAFILLNASSPLAPSGLANMPPATCPLLGTIV